MDIGKIMKTDKKPHMSADGILGLILERIRSLPEGRVFVAAIDGRCASGKTTLSALLKERLDAAGPDTTASVIHMDDFFLPPSLRSPERLLEPGGNVHYERFSSEVFLPLKALKESSGLKPGPVRLCSTAISYRRFDCSVMNYIKEPVRLAPSRIYIVEGAYCLRPEFRELYDLKIFASVSSELQSERILKRNGPEAREVFRKKWIPMEESYFDFFDIEGISEVLFDKPLKTV